MRRGRAAGVREAGARTGARAARATAPPCARRFRSLRAPPGRSKCRSARSSAPGSPASCTEPCCGRNTAPTRWTRRREPGPRLPPGQPSGKSVWPLRVPDCARGAPLGGGALVEILTNRDAADLKPGSAVWLSRAILVNGRSNLVFRPFLRTRPLGLRHRLHRAPAEIPTGEVFDEDGQQFAPAECGVRLLQRIVHCREHLSLLFVPVEATRGNIAAERSRHVLEEQRRQQFLDF